MIICCGHIFILSRSDASLRSFDYWRQDFSRVCRAAILRLGGPSERRREKVTFQSLHLTHLATSYAMPSPTLAQKLRPHAHPRIHIHMHSRTHHIRTHTLNHSPTLIHDVANSCTHTRAHTHIHTHQHTQDTSFPFRARQTRKISCTYVHTSASPIQLNLALEGGSFSFTRLTSLAII